MLRRFPRGYEGGLCSVEDGTGRIFGEDAQKTDASDIVRSRVGRAEALTSTSSSRKQLALRGLSVRCNVQAHRTALASDSPI
jgi:hypothetical protein